MVQRIDEIGERRARSGQGIRLSRTILAVALFFLVSLLLNGEALHRNADQMPYGPVRQISLRLTAPLRAVSRASRLPLLRAWIETTWNKEPLP